MLICILQTQRGWSQSLRAHAAVCPNLRGTFPAAAPTANTVITPKMYKKKHSGGLLF